MLTEIDDSSDPIPSTRYTVRVRGDHIEAAPKVSNKLVNRTRRWMIRDEWLKNDQNKKFDVPTRIAESGNTYKCSFLCNCVDSTRACDSIYYVITI